MNSSLRSAVVLIALSSHLLNALADVNISIATNNASSLSPTIQYTTIMPTESPIIPPDLIFYDTMKKINSWTESASDLSLIHI
mgnify:CR=1 FL=1